MKLLLDMNLSPRWTGLLRDAGWEAVHWSSLGKGDEPDSQIMAYAAERGYVVLTADIGFQRHSCRHSGEKPSVVQLRTEGVTPRLAGRA
jgi:predicted nuclease of predicted toxin-antitoxin system